VAQAQFTPRQWLKPEQLLRVGPEHVASDGTESSAERPPAIRPLRARAAHVPATATAEEPCAKSSASPRKHPTFGGETVRGATTTTDRCTAATTRIRHILTWNGRKRCRAAREHGHGRRPQSSILLGARATASMPLKHARQPHASVLGSVRPRPVSISTHGPSGNRINLGRKKCLLSVLLVTHLFIPSGTGKRFVRLLPCPDFMTPCNLFTSSSHVHGSLYWTWWVRRWIDKDTERITSTTRNKIGQLEYCISGETFCC
jgi:hypothetical protein